ncbi:DHA2 family efflux MFS transporter permease subunit [Streptomyces sp. NPDC007325]|uniref:DHA2 family efflux MFS transporter permease subunit n=1 Tax=unclassified Streptomyces TaxID=2593676 RepID=UPI0033FA5B8B
MTSMPQTDSATGSTPALSPLRAPRPWLVVLVACAGQFLVVLDVSVMNVALPSLKADLGLGTVGLQWVLNAYSIAFAGFMLLGGRAADLYGRKTMFLAGLGLFTAASVVGGIAPEGSYLIAARAAQGLGAAALSPATLTLVTSAVPAGAARTRAIATWTAVGAAGGAAGGFVGGLLVDLLDWRWVLLVNVPIGIVVLAAAALWLREGRAATGRRLDLPGAVLVTAGLATLAYGIVQTETAGWTSAATLLPLLGGLALIAVFVAVERRTREPLVPLGIFRNRAVSAANAGIMLCGASSFAMWFFMTVYAQNVLGYTPLEAGLALVPSSLAVLVGSKTAPRIMAATGAKPLAVAGILVAAAGFAWQSTMTADGTFLTTILGPGILMMGGIGLATTPLATLATSGAAPGDAGLVSGLVNTSRTMGGALGLAVLTTVAASTPVPGPDFGLTGAPDGSHLVPGYAMAFRVSAGLLLTAAALMAIWLPRAVHRTARKP